ncbi:bifunctional DNA-formamidopyrimidine glycosylase/DNA-(apurinic or apyrimidinic site) lyase [Aidingimonas lacisalsi]|uniref:bifunctional DNA-formamidopyrimidine glycosylase/DNA-(apurinic or apyrimidinic site) lyase n=1 Tax=Aidingimonas lacisalsi TaxID=2604086 RepID=UPI0011D28760|nr:bifunctional DNA-formamidopyrimidine glycosylase/DNA-(apurinic or apyrimidinic site) lyase [Aidingimonas lacisalsi]
MPELPEVETTRRGIAPHLEGREIAEVVVRERRMRTPVPEGLENALVGACIGPVGRRAKYLLIPLTFQDGGTRSLLWHLGMSGSLRIVRVGDSPRKHDHVDIVVEGGYMLRYHDPRRFGFIDWVEESEARDVRLAKLGPEPLSSVFDGEYLYRASRGRRLAVKSFLMDNTVVVGVGNIYAAEALFLAGIDPRRMAGRVGRDRYDRLAAAVQEVLSAAIAQGGTTLRDFVSGAGEPGYFAQRLNVYGRNGQPCRRCGAELRLATVGQRASVFCAHCQK